MEIKREELVKVYDAAMVEITPAVVTKKAAHANGLWHKHFDCWLVRRDLDDDYILFQLRSDKKKSYPGRLDISVAGHIEAHEEVHHGIREIKEELGVDVELKSLRFAGIFRNIMDIKELGRYEREFCYTYITERQERLEDYRLQEEEVAGLYEARIPEALKFFAGDLEKIELRGIVRRAGGYLEDEKTIYRHDLGKAFMPYFGGYYLRVMIMAERYLAGEKYLAI